MKKLVPGCNLPDTEKAFNTYVRARIAFAEGESIFLPEGVIQKTSMRIREELVKELSRRLHAIGADPLHGDRDTIKARIKCLQHLKACKHWTYTFLGRNAFSGFKAKGQNGIHDVKTIESVKQDLREFLWPNSPRYCQYRRGCCSLQIRY